MRIVGQIPKRGFPCFCHKLAWEQRKLGDVAEFASGFMGDSLLSDGVYELTRIETISTGEINYQRVGYSNEDPGESYKLHSGDILYSNINSIPYIGNVALYAGEKLIYHGINLLRLRPFNDINPSFLLQQLRTDICRKWAQSRANQAVSQASINQSLLQTQPVSVCSCSEQTEVAKFLVGIDNLITLHQGKLECSIGSRNPSAKDIRIEIHGPIRDDKSDEPLMPVVRVRPAIARMNGLNGSLSGVSKGGLEQRKSAVP